MNILFVDSVVLIFFQFIMSWITIFETSYVSRDSILIFAYSGGGLFWSMGLFGSGGLIWNYIYLLLLKIERFRVFKICLASAKHSNVRKKINQKYVHLVSVNISQENIIHRFATFLSLLKGKWRLNVWRHAV